MRFVSKVNFKKFIPLSVATLILFSIFAKTTNELIVIIGVYIATIGNLFMLTEGILELTRTDTLDDGSELKTDKDKVIYLFIGKIFLLILALTLGVQIIGNRIIIPVINYIFQIFVLVLSLKKA